MAGPVMNKARKNIIFILAALSLAGCQTGGPGNETSAVPEGNLVGARIGGDFALTDQTGKTVRWSDFKGKYRLVYFGYTWCPDVCPVDLNKFMAGLKLLEASDPEKAAKIQPIFITVDPERDTPDVIAPYVAAFHPRLIGLTGTPEQIEAVKKDFVVIAGKEGDPAATSDYLVSHTRTPALFDPDGKPIALVPVDDVLNDDKDSAPPEAVRDFLAAYVR
ncbi:copper chaperone SCO1/SenC family protein [Sphingobium sp. SYK-6]|uniref:SCO family protein n=1 Tax=Sphingobium sp. (strain NBRC 103272 / SYK-6) TaxID=627192 RepID=UPI0002277EBC|nr:copper chaperone SCO1/SenC family protein [Sphingobium sp. SYK-6]